MKMKIASLNGEEKIMNVDLQFKNISEFKRYLDKNSHITSYNDILTSKRYYFFETNNWNEFEEYLSNGNKEITVELKKQTKYYVDKFKQQYSYSSAYVFDVVGEFFDIGAVMVGEPEAWIKEVKIEDEKFITLDIQGVYKDGTNLELIKKNGSKVFAIAIMLEEQGYLVKINMHYSSVNSGGDNTTFNATVMVKDYDQTLDYKKFGILLGVPFFRRGILRALEIEFGVDLVPGFGKPNYDFEGQIRLDEVKDINNLEAKLMEKE